MKTFLSKILIVASILTTIHYTSATLTKKYFTQKLDHFNKTDETFEQRYFENRAVFKEGGPIILYLGGMEAAEPRFILGGPLLEIAVEKNGVLIYLEHRYFGESIPFAGNLSLENMEYLTVENTLADVTYFIKYLNETFPEYEKPNVLLAGASYSGALTIWHRQEYPNNVTRCTWSSSPKLLSKPDVPEYKQVISKNLVDYSYGCKDKIHAGIEEMLYELKWLNTTQRIQDNFKLCSPINTNDGNDVMRFFEVITTMLEVVKTTQSAEIFCRTIYSIEDNILALAVALYSQIANVDCLDTSYSSALSTYRNELDKTNKRAELYLQCKQLGWFKSGGSRHQPFGYLPTFDYFVDLCRNAIDSTITAELIEENSETFNKKFRGLNPRSTHSFMTMGVDDPERSLVPDKEFDSFSKLQKIKDAQHSYDLYWWVYPQTSAIETATDTTKRWIVGNLN